MFLNVRWLFSPGLMQEFMSEAPANLYIDAPVGWRASKGSGRWFSGTCPDSVSYGVQQVRLSPPWPCPQFRNAERTAVLPDLPGSRRASAAAPGLRRTGCRTGGAHRTARLPEGGGRR